MQAPPRKILIEFNELVPYFLGEVQQMKQADWEVEETMQLLIDHISEEKNAERDLKWLQERTIDDHDEIDAREDGIHLARAIGWLGTYMIDVLRRSGAYSEDGKLPNGMFFMNWRSPTVAEFGQDDRFLV